MRNRLHEMAYEVEFLVEETFKFAKDLRAARFGQHA
jgi:hypothetical protein